MTRVPVAGDNNAQEDTEHSTNTAPLIRISSDFYTGYQKATRDFELKYQRQTVPIDEEQLCMIFVRVACETVHNDLWETGHLAGFFAALFHSWCTWTVSANWTLGEMAHVHCHIDSMRRVS